MDSGEAQALGRLTGRAMAGTASFAEELHRAIFTRSAGAAGAQTKAIHDGVSTAVYAGLRGVFRGVGEAAGAALSVANGGESDPLKDGPAGSVALGALNGLHGDLLHRDRNELAIEMAVRRRRRDLALDSSSLAEAFPNPTSRLVVFVHGLCGTEETWSWFGGHSTSYGARLARDLGFTPLYVRYNTGLHISDNGARLVGLLTRAVDSWPVDVSEIVLVGHSMGGLVVRSACHYGEESEEDWVDGVRHVFCLASPHLGAPLEKAANVAAWALGSFPETAPLARIVNGRSEGIKDLRFGYLIDQDWEGQDPDALLENNRHDIRFLETANYYYVGATLTRDPGHPLGHLVGDLLVRLPSASGQGARGQRIPFEIDNGHHAGGLTHFHVLNNADVYRQILAWLERDTVGERWPPPSEAASAGSARRGSRRAAHL
jgi:pimeloyl-ACP methyl ester carboxylesterase